MPQKFWDEKNILVTGCTGLLGSWLTRSLVEKGANVVGLIRDLVPKSNLNGSGINKKITTVRGELEDYSILERTLNEYEIDTVFHLGAQTIVTIANRSPLSTFESNIKGTWNILEACRKSPLVERIVCASSDKAYGEQKELPYNENTPLEGRHPYDVSKSCSDLLCSSYYETYGLPVCVTRCGNFYGGGDLNFNRIVPGTIRSILKHERPIIRSDGSMVRDYFYIEDGAAAYMLLAEKMKNSGIHGHAFNFSNEQPLTVLEIADKVLKVMKSDLEPVVLNEASNEIKYQYLSSKNATQMLKWKPIYTIEDGLQKTVEWYQKFFDYNSKIIDYNVDILEEKELG